MRRLSVGSIATIETPRWYAIHTKPKEEERATSNLLSWRVETFTPRIKERRVNRGTGKTTSLIKPLFPRYIFARFDASKMLHKIYYTRGVHSVVSFGDSPVPVDDEAIAFIQSRVEKDGFIKFDDDLMPGDEVMIKDGPLKGFNGVFSRTVKDTDRVMILLKNVSYQASIVLDREQVRKTKPETHVQRTGMAA
jgi:transcriptional antiterminator RfaH